MTAEVKSDLKSIIKYLDTFECILMSAVWIKILTMIHEVNLIIEFRDATLDVEMMNISLLQGDIKNLREKWDDILKEARYVSNNLSVSDSFEINSRLRSSYSSQEEAEDNFRVNVFTTSLTMLLMACYVVFQQPKISVNILIFYGSLNS